MSLEHAIDSEPAKRARLTRKDDLGFIIVGREKKGDAGFQPHTHTKEMKGEEDHVTRF